MRWANKVHNMGNMIWETLLMKLPTVERVDTLKKAGDIEET